jgi:hypothetical protein
MKTIDILSGQAGEMVTISTLGNDDARMPVYGRRFRERDPGLCAP